MMKPDGRTENRALSFVVVLLIGIGMVLGSQWFSPPYIAVFIVGGALCTLFSPSSLKILLLTLTVYLIGYALSIWLKMLILDVANAHAYTTEMKVIVSRFSLIGYLIPLAVLQAIQKANTNYFTLGKWTPTIQFPFIWWGIRDPIWRYVSIAMSVMLVSCFFLIDFQRDDLWTLLLYGILFALINSILEELLWRGYMLARFVDVFGEKLGLIGTSAAFGMYHYSLGFGLPICFVFTVTGLLLGGVVIRSKGLLPAIAMHALMNVIFVFTGIIFG